MALQPVALEKSYRLLNLGMTNLISAKADGGENVMAATWAWPLDYGPARVTLTISKFSFTRTLIEKSGTFAIHIPPVAMRQQTLDLGQSRNDNPNKLADNGIELFYADGFDVPLVKGCLGHLICEVLPEPHIQDTYDLFVANVVGALADDRVFRDGHWELADAPPELKPLFYVSGGHFYTTGEEYVVKGRFVDENDY